MRALIVIGATVLSACTPQIVDKEPPGGTIPYKDVVLVDDGTCPAGQIKEVVGGNNQLGIDRSRRCIPRP